MRKPIVCAGCPLFGDGEGYVPDEIVPGATTTLLFQNPGETEEKEERPLVGKTGEYLESRFLPLAQLQRGENVNLCNVLKCRWTDPKTGKKTNTLPPAKILQPAIEQCVSRHLRIPSETRLLVASGALAWDTIGGPRTISSWRGFLAPGSRTETPSATGLGGNPGIPVLGTLHVADLFRDIKMVIPSMKDWEKVSRFHKGVWPLPIPHINTSPYEVAWEDGMSFDTEYSRTDATKLFRFSAYTPSGVLSVVEADRWNQAARGGWSMFENPAGITPFLHVVLQDSISAADLDHLANLLPGVKVTFDDIRLMHQALWSEWPHDLEFIASMYSPYEKTKHLSQIEPVKYAGGDALDTRTAYVALKKEMDADPRSRHIYETRLLPLVPVLRRAHLEGIRVHRERARAALSALENVGRDAARRTQAILGYPLNLGSTKQVVAELKRRGITTSSVDSEHVITALRLHPGDDVLMGRLRAAQAEGFRRYVAPIVKSGADRVYPSFLPTQATGRISVTDPPIVGFPDDGKALQRGFPTLRDIFIPDEGHWWLSWDWSAMHARFLAAAADDKDDLAAFKNGWDMHLMTAARVYTLPEPPSWKDAEAPENEAWRAAVQWVKKDRRRHLMKTVRYALYNGIDEKAVRESHEAVELGMDMDELERIARKFLQRKSMWTIWKRKFANEAIKAGEARSLYGRKRRILGKDWREKAKAAISGFLQMTEVDIMTETLIEVCRMYPEGRLVYPSHDGIKLQFPDSTDPGTVFRNVKPFAEREHNFGVNTIPLPCEWETVREDGTKETL